MVRSTLSGILVVATALSLPACQQPEDAAKNTSSDAATTPAADKPFVAGGKINVDLDGGGYEIKTADDNHIRVAVGGNTGDTKVDVTVNGSSADVKVKNTPHNNFRAIVEVPATADVVVRLSGGELKMEAITGNKDVESYAGNVQIAVGNPDDYASVDAAVKAGDLNASPFGGSKSGLLQEFTWSGKGKYTLRAHLGAGNLVLAK
ncbi:MAG TPA: hypothetical protein VL882_14060 [Vicinamibacterales bacterium]|jgi:hypothetical protein|nr:hypothetical protein [Vicinamibacterales bacterium]